MALTKLAEVALRRKDHRLATERLNAALAIEPHFAPAWGELSHARWLAGRCLDALEAARQAVAIQPPNPTLRLQLAQVAAWTGHAAEARQALAPLLDPDWCERSIHATAVSLLGELAIAQGRFDEADTHLREALRLLPTRSATRMMHGMNQLRLGRFADGWVDYAAREDIAALFPDGCPVLPGEVWQGQDLAGKTILVADDQGHGDAIQFFRYLPLLKARGAKAHHAAQLRAAGTAAAGRRALRDRAGRATGRHPVRLPLRVLELAALVWHHVRDGSVRGALSAAAAAAEDDARPPSGKAFAGGARVVR